MNPEHAKSLTPKHLRLEPHELDRMRPETLAAIMAKWPTEVSDYFRLKYADHQSLRPKVFDWLFSALKPKAISEDWPMGKTHRLVNLAIDEALVQGECGWCGGLGRIPRPGRDIVTCARCYGSGRTRLTQHQRAKRIGVKQSTWSTVWQTRYAEIKTRLEWAEMVISSRR